MFMYFYAILQPKPETDDAIPPTDAYTEYLHKPNKNMNEHDYFFKAKAELQKHHHEKVTKVSGRFLKLRSINSVAITFQIWWGGGVKFANAADKTELYGLLENET